MASITVSRNPYTELAAPALAFTARLAEILGVVPPQPPNSGKWVITASAGVALPVTDWISKHAREPARVKQFCTQHNLIEDARRALSLATQQSFGEKTALYVEQDPESDAEWLVVEVPIEKDAPDLLNRYARITDDWTATCSDQARPLIHFTFKLV